MLIFVLLLLKGLLSRSWSLNANCTSAVTTCTFVKAGFIAASATPCMYTPTYITCIDNILATTSACDELSTLVLRDTTYSEAKSTNLRLNCSYDIPEVFLLNDCEKQKSNCSKLSAYLFDEGDINKKCEYLETFRSCFDKTTAACEDRSDIVRIVNMELTRLQYNSTCVGWQTTTALTSTASLSSRQGSTTITTSTTTSRTTTSTTAATTTRGRTDPATTTTTTVPSATSTAAPTTPDNSNSNNNSPGVLVKGGNGGNIVVSSVTWMVLLTTLVYMWART